MMLQKIIWNNFPRSRRFVLDSVDPSDFHRQKSHIFRPPIFFHQLEFSFDFGRFTIPNKIKSYLVDLLYIVVGDV